MDKLFEAAAGHMDKFLILFVIAMFSVLLFHMLHDGHDAAAVSWLEQLITGLVGSLITLITGQAMRSFKNGNGNTPAPTPAAPAAPHA